MAGEDTPNNPKISGFVYVQHQWLPRHFNENTERDIFSQVDFIREQLDAIKVWQIDWQTAWWTVQR